MASTLVLLGSLSTYLWRMLWRAGHIQLHPLLKPWLVCRHSAYQICLLTGGVTKSKIPANDEMLRKRQVGGVVFQN